MNKPGLYILFHIGVLFILTACQTGRQSPGTPKLGPGDTIDGMRLTTGAADATPLWAFCFLAQQSGNTRISDCNVPPMVSKLGIGHVFMLANETLTNSDWSDLTWELYIDEKAVDLKSFGTYAFVLPTMPHNPSRIREVFTKFAAWDVTLTNLVPGEYILHGLAKSESDSYTWVVNLTIETSD